MECRQGCWWGLTFGEDLAEENAEHGGLQRVDEEDREHHKELGLLEHGLLLQRGVVPDARVHLDLCDNGQQERERQERQQDAQEPRQPDHVPLNASSIVKHTYNGNV